MIEKSVTVPDEIIMSKIYFIRGHKVMLDMDLAKLYDVDTKQLKRSVRRNIDRFPEDFMIELSKEELINWRCKFGTSNREKMGLRILPFAFTEYGVLMVASILRCKRAIEVNIQIVRIFIKMREMLHTHKEIMSRLDQIEGILSGYDDNIRLLFDYIKELESIKKREHEQKKHSRIGFKYADQK